MRRRLRARSGNVHQSNRTDYLDSKVTAYCAVFGDPDLDSKVTAYYASKPKTRFSRRTYIFRTDRRTNHTQYFARYGTHLFGRHGRTDGRTHRFSRISESSGLILGDLKRALPSKKLSFWGPFKNTKKLNKRRLRAHTPILASLGKLRRREI